MSRSAAWVLFASAVTLIAALLGAVAVSEDSEASSATVYGSPDVGAEKIVFDAGEGTGGYTQYVLKGEENSFYFPSAYTAPGSGCTPITWGDRVLIGWHVRGESGVYSAGAECTDIGSRTYTAVWGNENMSVYNSMVEIGSSVNLSFTMSDDGWKDLMQEWYKVSNGSSDFKWTLYMFHSASQKAMDTDYSDKALKADWLTASVTWSGTTATMRLSGTPDHVGTYMADIVERSSGNEVFLFWSVYDPDTDPSNLRHCVLDNKDANGTCVGPYGTAMRLPDSSNPWQKGWSTTVNGAKALYPLGGAMTILNADRAIEVANYTSKEIASTGLVGVVAYNANGGSSNGQIAALTATDGCYTLAGSDLVSKPGFVCIGWNETGSVYSPVYPFGHLYDIDGRKYVEMRAVWADPADAGTVTFHNPGDAVQDSSFTVYSGYTYVLPTNGFALSGYVFKGWSETRCDPGEGTAIDSDTVEITGSRDYYAVFEKSAPASFTVHYDANGGTGTMDDQEEDPDSVPYGVVLKDSAFSRSGYAFLGWSDSSTAESPSFLAGDEYTVTVGGSVTLYAVWTKVTDSKVSYSVVYTGEGTRVAGLPDPDLLTGTPVSYKVVKSYSYVSNGETETVESELPTGCITMKELYALRTVAVPAEYNAEIETASVYGFEYTVSSDAPVRAGCTFEGWSTVQGGKADIAAGTRMFLIVSYDEIPGSFAGELDLHAVWSGEPASDAKECTVVLKWYKGTLRTDTVLSGERIALPDVSRDGYAFIGWLTDDGTRWSSNSAVTGDMTLTASFVKVFHLEIDGTSVRPVLDVEASSAKVSYSDGFETTYYGSIGAHEVAVGSSGYVTVEVPSSDGKLTATCPYSVSEGGTDPEPEPEPVKPWYEDRNVQALMAIVGIIVVILVARRFL